MASSAWSGVGTSGAAWAATVACQSAATAGQCARSASSQISRIASRSVSVVSLPPCKFGLPQQPARMLRPAAKVDQQPVKGRLGRMRRSGRAVPARAGWRVRRCRARRRHGRRTRSGPAISGVRSCVAQSRQAAKAPCPGAGRPQRLAPVEVPRRPEAEAARDHGRASRCRSRWPPGPRPWAGPCGAGAHLHPRPSAAQGRAASPARARRSARRQDRRR